MFHLKPKPSPPRYVGPRHARPGGRLLGRGDDARLAAVRDLVHLLEHLDGLEVLAAAELVRHPLARLARVVQVEHRGDGVDADAVGVVLAQPEQGVGDEEVADLAAPVVEDQRAPVGMRAAARVRVLVQRRAVEAGEREVVAREVRRHPVEDHAEAVRVQPVDELPEVVGRAEARRRGEVARDLVAPRAGERMGHHRHQLDVGEPHVARVGGQLVGQLEVVQRAVALERVEPPGAEVDLVDRDRPLQRVALAAAAQPLLVLPHVPGLVDHRGGLGRDLCLEGHRVRLQPQLAVRGDELELVAVAGADAGQEQLPDAGRAERPHRVDAAVPEVPVAHHRHGARGGGPDGERGAADALELAHVGAEALPQLLVAALADEVQVQLADRRQEAVRVLGLHRPVAVVDLVAVGHGQLDAGEPALEDAAGVGQLERDGVAVVHHDGDGARRGSERAHHDGAVAVRVGAEVGMRLRVLAGEQAIGVVHLIRHIRSRSEETRRAVSRRRGRAARAGCAGGSRPRTASG